MSHTAIVILNYNGVKLLSQFLPTVLLNSSQAEVIVADNGSTDQSVDFLQTNYPAIRIIQLNENYGFCGGYNRALQQVDADYYILLNSDVEVTAGWLIPIIKLLDSNPLVAAVQPKILSYTRRHLFEYAGAAGGFIDRLGYPFCRGRVFDFVEEDKGQYNDERAIFWASGACLAIRSDAFHKFKLDEDFFAHMEEIDLCWKLHRAGYEIRYCGSSTVYHLGAGTLNYSSPRKTYLNFRNGLFLFYRHLSPGALWIRLPIRFVLDWIAALIFLLKGGPAHFIAVLKSHKDFFYNFPRERYKRQQLGAVYPRKNPDTIYNGSIVIDYFLRRRKKLVK